METLCESDARILMRPMRMITKFSEWLFKWTHNIFLQLADMRYRLKQVAHTNPTLSPSAVFKQVLTEMGLDEKTDGAEMPKLEALVCYRVYFDFGAN